MRSVHRDKLSLFGIVVIADDRAIAYPGDGLINRVERHEEPLAWSNWIAKPIVDREIKLGGRAR